MTQNAAKLSVHAFRAKVLYLYQSREFVLLECFFKKHVLSDAFICTHVKYTNVNVLETYRLLFTNYVVWHDCS